MSGKVAQWEAPIKMQESISCVADGKSKRFSCCCCYAPSIKYETELILFLNLCENEGNISTSFDM